MAYEINGILHVITESQIGYDVENNSWRASVTFEQAK